MDLGFGPLTWTCHVCRDERLDACISVAHRRQLPDGVDRTDNPLFPDGYPVHVRYCNDRPACVAEATADEPWRKPVTLS